MIVNQLSMTNNSAQGSFISIQGSTINLRVINNQGSMTNAQGSMINRQGSMQDSAWRGRRGGGKKGREGE